MTVEKSSYGEILRSSSIVGGAQVGNFVIGLVRVKLIAMLLGPAGVGLIGLYTSTIGLVGTLSGLGVGSSGVREIARAYGQGNAEEAKRTVIILRRLCWCSGVLGWALAVIFRKPISLTVMGSEEHANAIAWLGATLLLGAISGGQLALLQGLRRVGDLARANVTGAALGSIVSVAIYFALGEAGIVPALIAYAIAALGCSFHFARKLAVEPLSVGLGETWGGFRRVISLGIAFMWSAALAIGLDILTRAIIARQFGLGGAGIYQAAWALSGMLASFVLSAMGTDFYPRLTSIIHDHTRATRAVNEQTEIAALLAMPGVLTALTFAPLAIKLFYTGQFLPAGDLLPWMAVGVFGRVISWPLGYVLLALGAARWYVVTETICIGVWAALTYFLVERHGIIGAAYAFALIYPLYLAGMLAVTRMLIGFSWSSETRRLVLASAAFIGSAFATRFLWSDAATLTASSIVTFSAVLFSLRGLAARLGEEHRLVTLVQAAPGGRFLLRGALTRLRGLGA